MVRKKPQISRRDSEQLFASSTLVDHRRSVFTRDFPKDHTFYYENIEGGHGGAADNKQRAFMQVAQPLFCRIVRLPA